MRWVRMLVVAAALVPGSARAAAPTFDKLGARALMIVGKNAARVIVSSTRAEAYRLYDPPRGPPTLANPPKDTDVVAGYHVLGKAQSLDDLTREGFRDVLLSADSYENHDEPPSVRSAGHTRLCGGFRPGVAVRFWDPNDPHLHADALLCFNCSEVEFVPSKAEVRPAHKKGETAYYNRDYFDPARTALLRLAAATFPEDPALARLLTVELDKSSSDTSFVTNFRPRSQLLLLARGDSSYGDRKAQTAMLRQEMADKDLLAMAARAFGARRGEWSQSDRATEIVLGAVRTIPAPALSAGLEMIAGDQVALAGAAEMYGRGALAALPLEAQRVWLPRLVEAAVAQSPRATFCLLFPPLAGLPGGAGLSLVRRAARGELPTALRPWHLDPSPAARACALMALATADAASAREAAARWSPDVPIAATAVRAVRYRLGDDRALEASLLTSPSKAILNFVLAGIRARPTRAALDLLVAKGLLDESGSRSREGEETFAAVTGFSFSALADAPDEARARAAQTWWAEHAGTWQPPR